MYAMYAVTYTIQKQAILTEVFSREQPLKTSLKTGYALFAASVRAISRQPKTNKETTEACNTTLQASC